MVSKNPPPVVKPKALSSQKLKKKEADMVREAEAEAKARASDPKAAAAHKLALAKMQEDAGKKDVEALFGGSTVGDDGPKREKRSNPDPLKALDLKTPAQFDQFANDIAKKILPTDQDKVCRCGCGCGCGWRLHISLTVHSFPLAPCSTLHRPVRTRRLS